jgi:uncharacterized integral membrane protein
MVDMSPHVSAVFKELFEEIKSAKQQQWTITNYGVLILAAIYAVGHQLPAGVTHLHSKLKFLAILAFAIAVVGSYFLLQIQSHMARSRRRLDNARRRARNSRRAFCCPATGLELLLWTVVMPSPRRVAAR